MDGTPPRKPRQAGTVPGASSAGPRRTALRLGILALEDGVLSSIAQPLDALRVAERLGELRDPAGAPLLEGRLIAAGGKREVRTSIGIVLRDLAAVDANSAEPLPQVLLVPGVMHQDAGDVLHKLKSCHAEVELIRALHLRGVRIAAACSGTFLLAATGLLDGRTATTTWWLADAFRRAFPNVRLQAERMVADEGALTTAGAADGIMHVVLRLIAEATDPQLAQQTARLLMIDADRQSQAPWVVQAMVERPRDSLAERVERFLQKQLHRELGVAEIAAHCGTSERSLLRHFQATYGESPQRRLQRLRIERAKALLETTHLSLEEIIERCGYSDPASFRKLFKRSTDLTPGDYRERFRLRVH